MDSAINIDGPVTIGGIQMTANSTKRTLTFKMPGHDVTVADIPAAGLIAVATDEYVTLSNWEVEPVVIDGVYYVPADTDVTVTVADGGKFGTMPAANEAAGQKHMTKAGSNVHNSGDTITIDASYAIHAVTDVTTLANVDATYEKADGNDVPVSNTMSIVRGTVLDVAASDGASGVIEGTTVGALEGTTYKVGTEDVVLSAAREVTLYDNVTATAGGVAITETKNGVATSQPITVTAPSGLTAIELTGERHGTAVRARLLLVLPTLRWALA